MSYLLLACHRGEESKEAILSVLKSRVASYVKEVSLFQVPENLKFGTFDSLIKLMDDLAKFDAQVETVVRRIERQMLDLDQNADFKVLFRQKTMTVESYIRSFVWDETKFPRNRALADNLGSLMQNVQRIDEDVKNKAYQFSDSKTAIQNNSKAKGVGLSLVSADLVDILTPEVVRPGDFIEKEHLVTVLVVVPGDSEKEFLESYEGIHEFVVPRSAKKFEKIERGKVLPISDKDGASLWRVLIFKSALEQFAAGCKKLKMTVREFRYSPEAYHEQQQLSSSLQTELQKQEAGLKRHCAAAFSDALLAWMHLKSMRIFVEAILRYGVPPNFAGFVVKPTSAKSLPKLRTALGEVFRASGLFGQSYIGNAADAKADAIGGEDEQYFPYVSLNLSPFAEEKK